MWGIGIARPPEPKPAALLGGRFSRRSLLLFRSGLFLGRFGDGDGFGFGLFPVEIGEAAAAFLNFVSLLSHKENDSR